MRVLGIVPARRCSKRLPGKNTRPLGAKPLVAWAIEAALGARRIDYLAVSSDDPRVLEIARAYPGVTPIERPSELATDTAPPVEYVRHALAAAEAMGERGFDAVAIIQPSSPLSHSSDVDATLELLDRTGADTAVTVQRVPHDVHPAKFLTMSGGRLAPFVKEAGQGMAAHELPEVYVRNGAVYGTRLSVIAEGRIIGSDCRGYIMPRERSVDINDELDLRFAEFLLGETTNG